jgi:hypothetical protein
MRGGRTGEQREYAIEIEGKTNEAKEGYTEAVKTSLPLKGDKQSTVRVSRKYGSRSRTEVRSDLVIT